IARDARGVPTIVGSGAGVLTERGEVSGEPAAAGITWQGGSSEVIAVNPAGGDIGEPLAAALRGLGSDMSAAFVLAKADRFGPDTLEPMRELPGGQNIAGGGTVGSLDSFAVDASGRVVSGAAVALLVRGLPRPIIRSSPGCRLLMPLRRITAIRGAMVTGIGGEPALEVLSSAAQDLVGQPLVLAVLAAGDASEGQRANLLVRAVQGVDPVSGGLLISSEVRVGMLIAFAIRDSAAARADLETVVRELEREIAGALPRFGVYFNCAGRGTSLHGTRDVDIRILRSRLGSVPLAGMFSAFEIAPYQGAPALELYTGVLSLFTAPS
ncbi:MAG TPA: FIST C-terminal domain-containing protein, partial [Polyangiaceae bacterium]